MSPERKLARVLVRLDHVARLIVNVDDVSGGVTKDPILSRRTLQSP